MIGDERILSNGRIEKVISETPIRNYCQESPEQEKARQKKGLPARMYGYIAVKTETLDGDKPKNSEKQRLENEAKHVLNMDYQERQLYYKSVATKDGQKAVYALIAEVKKQRSLTNSQAVTM